MRISSVAPFIASALAIVGCGSGGMSSSSSTSGSGGGGGSAPATDAFIRLNQVGFEPGEAKRALLMTEVKPEGSCIVEQGGEGTKRDIGPLLGAWSDTFGHVAELDLPVAGVAGYDVASNGASAAFRVADAKSLYEPLLANAAFFYRAQRDGNDVDASVLERKPSHLTDKTASVYAPPQ